MSLACLATLSIVATHGQAHQQPQPVPPQYPEAGAGGALTYDPSGCQLLIFYGVVCTVFLALRLVDSLLGFKAPLGLGTRVGRAASPLYESYEQALLHAQ